MSGPYGCSEQVGWWSVREALYRFPLVDALYVSSLWWKSTFTSLRTELFQKSGAIRYWKKQNTSQYIHSRPQISERMARINSIPAAGVPMIYPCRIERLLRPGPKRALPRSSLPLTLPPALEWCTPRGTPARIPVKQKNLGLMEKGGGPV